MLSANRDELIGERWEYKNRRFAPNETETECTTGFIFQGVCSTTLRTSLFAVQSHTTSASRICLSSVSSRSSTEVLIPLTLAYGEIRVSRRATEDALFLPRCSSVSV